MTRASALTRHWMLDPSVTYLNHGSFGACPVPVLEVQSELQRRLERQPFDLFARDGYRLVDDARAALAAFLGARAADVAFVPNASTGVATIAAGLALEPGDKLLVTDHGYPACRNMLDHVAERTGAEVVQVHLPWPDVPEPDAVVTLIAEAVVERTKLVLIDHITSPTALVLPVAAIVAAVEARGVPVLVDGAHGPGSLDLDLDRIGASYYTGNCHKWLCTPKGSAFLHVRADRQPGLHPLVVSHGYTAPQGGVGRSKFHLEFDWTGTDDPTAYLAIPAAIDFIRGLRDGGWPEHRRANHELVMRGAEHVASALGIHWRPSPEYTGAMASFPLSGDIPPPGQLDPLQESLRAEDGIEVQVTQHGAQRVLRISAQAYNAEAQYELLAERLAATFGPLG